MRSSTAALAGAGALQCSWLKREIQLMLRVSKLVVRNNLTQKFFLFLTPEVPDAGPCLMEHTVHFTVLVFLFTRPVLHTLHVASSACEHFSHTVCVPVFFVVLFRCCKYPALTSRGRRTISEEGSCGILSRLVRVRQEHENWHEDQHLEHVFVPRPTCRVHPCNCFGVEHDGNHQPRMAPLCTTKELF